MNDATRRNAVASSSCSEASETNQSAKRIFSMTPLATAVIAALSPTEAIVAQEDDDDSIDVVIVTATKRELNLQDVPHSIDVLSSVELERIGAKSLEDVIKALPSVASFICGSPDQERLILLCCVDTSNQSGKISGGYSEITNGSPSHYVNQGICVANMLPYRLCLFAGR